MKTNRDLYLALTAVLKDKVQQDALPDLRAYIASLLQRSFEHAAEPGMPLDAFFRLLIDSFAVLDSDEIIATTQRPVPENVHVEYREVHERFLQQLADLAELERAGKIKDEYRYLGLSVSSGTWYNFDPCTYLECAMSGSFGGWMDGDDTGREVVPGDVAQIDEKGEIHTVNAADALAQDVVDKGLCDIDFISWEMFGDFLWCGQNYE